MPFGQKAAIAAESVPLLKEEAQKQMLASKKMDPPPNVEGGWPACTKLRSMHQAVLHQTASRIGRTNES
jgi:hypothetical protein